MILFLLDVDQVRKLLDDDPGNSEYADMEKELAEVIFFQISPPHFPKFSFQNEYLFTFKF